MKAICPQCSEVIETRLIDQGLCPMCRATKDSDILLAMYSDCADLMRVIEKSLLLFERMEQGR